MKPVFSNKTLRILDANKNRVLEGLRVLEDEARFARDDTALSGEIKQLRHHLSGIFSDLKLLNLTPYRDTPGDVGRPEKTSVPASSRRSVQDLLQANANRAKESLRVIEENFRLGCAQSANRVEAIRYKFYELEVKILNSRISLSKRLHSEPVCLLVTPGPNRPNCQTMAKQALDGGITFLQLRLKADLPGMTDGQHFAIANSLATLCQDYNALLVINDRVDIAAGLNLGAHLGQDDLPSNVARQILGPVSCLGISIHNQSELQSSNSNEIDYFGVGTIFSSKTKPELGQSGLDLLKELSPQIRKPLFGIGGITEANCQQVISAGATGVAVSSAILDSGDIQATSNRFVSLVRAAKA